MPISSKKEIIKEEGKNKEAYTISFTNGAKEQLEELKKHFKKENFEEVVKLGIGVLERLKDLEEKKNTLPTNE